MVFHAHWQRRFPHRWMKGEDLQGYFRMTTAFLIISLRWRITLFKQRGLCELSEIAETFSIVNVKVFRLFIYLIVSKHGSRGRTAKQYEFKETKDITPTREKDSSEWRLFSKMNFVTFRSTYHSSCYRVESRTSKNSDELWGCIEKTY